MSTDPLSPEDELDLAALERIERVCLEFEAVWREGRTPRIEDHLGNAEGAERSRLLRELLLLDFDYRGRAGEPPSRAQYHARFPADRALIDAAVPKRAVIHPEAKALFAEFVRRRKRGEKIGFRDFCAKHPERAGALRRLYSQRAKDAKARDGQGKAPGKTRPRDHADRLGDFRILEVLGEGGMGVVYLAEQVEPIRRRVALKLIKLGMDTKEVIARFKSERQALALMNHPNIAKVFEAGATAQGRPYFVMEYVPGEPIAEYCDRHRLNVRARLQLFLQICDALQHAHGKGIIHRDIKSSNVLVMMQDDKPMPKVIDFGVAKATGHRLTEETLFTARGQLIGTPEYMSPEQADLSPAGVDKRTDIYSLGVLLYELLVGALPFDSKVLLRSGYAEMQRIICEEEPPRPSTRLTALGPPSRLVAKKRRTDLSSLERQLQGDLDWVVLRAIEKAPARRYASVARLADDIVRHLHGKPVLARPPSAAYRLRKYLGRHRGVVMAASVVAALFVGVLTWAFWPDGGRPEESSEITSGREVGSEPPEVTLIAFDPHEQLEGYTDRYVGNYPDLYSFKPFEGDELKARPITRARLAELQAQWLEIREAGDEQVREVETNSVARYLYNQQKEIRQHRYFKKAVPDFRFERPIEARDPDQLPVALYVQKPRNTEDDPRYVERVTAEYAGWLTELQLRFRREYAAGGKLDRNDSIKAYAVAILALRGDYLNFKDAVAHPGLYVADAHYEPLYRLGVTYHDSMAPSPNESEGRKRRRQRRRHALLHEFVHALQHAFYTGADRKQLPKPIWFNEGLAEYLVSGAGDTPESLTKPSVPDEQLLLISLMLRDPKKRTLYFSPLRELVEAEGPGYRAVDENTLRRALRSGARRVDGVESLQWFYVQSCLFMHFLHGAGDRRYEPMLKNYAKSVMTGKSGWKVFAEAFGDHTDTLEAEFFAWLDERVGKIDETLRKKWLKRPLPPVRPEDIAPSGAGPAGVAKPEPSDPCDPGSLALTADEWLARLGAALHRARAGQIDEAIQALEERAPQEPGHGGAIDAGRIAREVGRLKEVRKLRDDLLQAKPRLTIGDRSGSVTGVDRERGTVELRTGPRRSERVQVPVSDLTASQLYKAADRNELFEPIDARWIGAYLLALEGKPLGRFAKDLELELPRARELRDDLEGYAAIRSLGEPAAALVRLSKREAPGDPKLAYKAFLELKDIRERHGRSELFLRREESLGSWARCLLERSFDPFDRDHLGTQGKIGRQPDGSIRLVYAFRNADEGKDFLEEPEYLRTLRMREGLPEVRGGSFRVRKRGRVNVYEGVGATCIRQVLPFLTPMDLTCELSLPPTGSSGPNERFEFWIGICDDGNNNHIRCNLIGDLIVQDSGAGIPPVKGLGSAEIRAGAALRLELHHDGEKLESTLNGKRLSRLPSVGSRTSGHLFLWIHSKIPIAISKLEITARGLDEKRLDGMRAKWVEGQLKGF